MANDNVSFVSYDDVEAMKQFIAALRNHAALQTEEADARQPKGSVAYPLSPKSIARDIRTKPELRALWNKLTPAQQDYAHNRYIRNTPARLEAQTDGASNPFLSPLEHDYQRTHNSKTYVTGRGLWKGMSRVFAPKTSAEGANVADYATSSVAGFGLKKVTPKWLVDALSGTHGDGDFTALSRDAIAGYNRGGYSQYAVGDPRAAVAQPTTTTQRVVERTGELTVPTATDIWTLGPIAKGLTAQGKLLQAYAAAAKAGGRPVVSFLANAGSRGLLLPGSVLNVGVSAKNPVDFTWRILKDPKKAWRAAAAANKKLIRAYKNIGRHGVKQAVKQTAKYAGGSALNAIGLAGDAGAVTTLAADAANNAFTPSITAQYTQAADNAHDFYMSHPQTAEARAAAIRSAYLRNNADKDWDDTDTIATAGTALGGALLGGILGGKHWLLGGLLGAGVGGLGALAYRLYKKRHG